MPTFAKAYFAGYITFVAWAHLDDLRSGKVSIPGVLTAVLGDICLMIAALSLWCFASVGLRPPFVLGLFTAGCASSVVEAIVSCRRSLADPSLTGEGKWFVSLAGTGLGLLAFAPLVYWGFLAAVLRQTSE